MPLLTLDLDEDTAAALVTAASQVGLSREDHAAGLLKTALASPAQIGWEAKELLKALRGFGARPAAEVHWRSVQTVWLKTNAAAGSEAMWAGVDQLAATGLIEPVNDKSSGVTLTEAGYRHV